MDNQLSFDFLKNLLEPLQEEDKSNTNSNYSVYRPIHYLGSKLRLLDAIVNNIDRVNPSMGAVCDLFSGSGTVALALSKSRNVVTVDVQEYSRVICSALLGSKPKNENAYEKLFDFIHSSEYATRLLEAVKPIIEHEQQCLDLAASGDLEPLCDFLEHSSLIAYQLGDLSSTSRKLKKVIGEVLSNLDRLGLKNSNKTLSIRYFGGVYFSFFQSVQLDILLEAIFQLSDDVRDIFMAALLSSASEAVNTVGKQFAQPLRPRQSNGEPKHTLYKLASRDRYIDIFKIYETWLTRYLSNSSSNFSHVVIRDDYLNALDLLHGKISVIYADPPYTRDHYSRFYHVLETLCVRDTPVLSKVRIGKSDFISRGLYREERHQSPFSIKSKAPDAFSNLFDKASHLGVPLVLSYSPFISANNARPRLMTIQQIEELAKRYYKRVEVISAGKISHSKLNRSDKNSVISYEAEMMFICEL